MGQNEGTTLDAVAVKEALVELRLGVAACEAQSVALGHRVELLFGDFYRSEAEFMLAEELRMQRTAGVFETAAQGVDGEVVVTVEHCAEVASVLRKESTRLEKRRLHYTRMAELHFAALATTVTLQGEER